MRRLDARASQRQLMRAEEFPNRILSKVIPSLLMKLAGPYLILALLPSLKPRPAQRRRGAAEGALPAAFWLPAK
jgi:hypothetical protein